MSYLRPHYDLPHPDVLLLSSTSWLVAGEAVVGQSGDHCMDFNENVTLWKTNDWNTIGRYPFSTKIRLEEELVVPLQFEQTPPSTQSNLVDLSGRTHPHHHPAIYPPFSSTAASMAKSQSPTLSSTSPPSLDPTAVGPIRHIRPRTHSRQTSGSLSTVSFNERADEPVTSPPLRHSISPSPPFFEPTSPLLTPVPTSNEQQQLHHSHVFDYTMPTLAEEDDASSTPGASSHDQSAPSSTGIGNGEEGASLVKLPTGKWQCPHCQKLFRRRDRAQAHVNVHVNTRPYSCDGSCGNHLCDRSYFSQESLQSHTQHAMIICETCGKELRKKNISRHRKRYCIVKSSTS